MKMLAVSRKTVLSIFVMMVLLFGVQSVGYSQAVCKVGDIIQPGESCTYPGTNDVFSVDNAGRARFLFFTAGGNLILRDSNINGKLYTLVTEHSAGGGRRIIELGGTLAPPEEPLTGEILQCSGVRRGESVDVTIRGYIRTTQDVRNLQLKGYANDSLVGSESLGDFSAGESKDFSITGSIITNANQVDCKVDFEWTSPPQQIDPEVLVVDPDAPPIYWTDLSADSIRRVSLDGSNVQDLLTQGLRTPTDIALDVAGGKMYWTDYGTEKIQRANLDGSNIEDLITQGLRSPSRIVLDVSSGKMYWTDWGTDKIQRANLDGSNIEDLITQGLETPDGIALDVSDGKMYWTDYDTEKIQRANLDGSNIEDLVTQGLRGPVGIALDVLGGKMYWTDINTEKIQRANLDGSNIEDLVTQGLDIPWGIALDVARGKMYWTHLNYNPTTQEFSNGKIQRANLDGSNVEDIVTGLGGGLEGIALGIPAVQQPTPQTDATVREDINGDGIVNIQDLVLVASNLGETGQNAADINGDGLVNIQDLVLVAGALGTNAAAPSLHPQSLEMLTAADIQRWLTQAQHLDLTDATSIRGMLFLQQLLITLTPKETALLANYPNPFNPETWIPYRLAKDADVTLHIYAANGTLVRTLILGHQVAGVYQTRSRAAYWDGKNALGEPVASGVYFYTFTAGDFTATRKMLIRK